MSRCGWRGGNYDVLAVYGCGWVKPPMVTFSCFRVHEYSDGIESFALAEFLILLDAIHYVVECFFDSTRKSFCVVFIVRGDIAGVNYLREVFPLRLQCRFFSHTSSPDRKN